ncbi:hypothetical protein ACFODZ_03460 [Marinicella sediminis]|uniref:Uncharacterized protein n=1 Tax=Marinicella sediminis TaxID=1792834 RepID=A0ABV7J550_9GAMM|nr:hypothetical protein [Marinicella sediminis]
MPKKPIRNQVARAPIMRKGGVHEKSNKAKRQQDKQSFKQKLRARDYGPFLCSTEPLDNDFCELVVVDVCYDKQLSLPAQHP